MLKSRWKLEHMSTRRKRKKERNKERKGRKEKKKAKKRKNEYVSRGSLFRGNSFRGAH